MKSRRRWRDVAMGLAACFGLWTLFAIPIAYGLFVHAADRASLNLTAVGVLLGIGPSGLMLCGALAVMLRPTDQSEVSDVSGR